MPKKLIRQNITEKLKPGEWETITDKKELNDLYALKIQEELEEIKASDHKDIFEFVDLVEVIVAFSMENGFTADQLEKAGEKKFNEKGGFSNIALNNLNPINPSNKIYFPSPLIKSENDLILHLENRIKELRQADSEFCKDRWNMKLPEFQRSVARDMSNQVTFARQELERLLKIIKPKN